MGIFLAALTVWILLLFEDILAKKFGIFPVILCILLLSVTAVILSYNKRVYAGEEVSATKFAKYAWPSIVGGILGSTIGVGFIFFSRQAEARHIETALLSAGICATICGAVVFLAGLSYLRASRRS